MSDILDGYFPYDLKTKYPDGVPLKPVDLTDETYSEQTKVKPFVAKTYMFRITLSSKYLET